MASDLRVLLAHFDEGQLGRMTRLVEAEGASVVAVSNGTEALERAQKERPSLALISTLLAGLHGFEVCRRLSHLSGDGGPIPVILLTDLDDPYVRARARHVGAKKVCLEPLEAAQLKELLEVPWEMVDPLELSTRTPGRSEDLIKDLMSEGSQKGGMLAKLSDPLTGLINEQYMALRVQEESKRASRYGQPLSLLVAEIDNFEQIVVGNGRRAGDEAMLEVAGVFLCESRDVDVAGREGRSGFQLLMPNTPAEGAQTAARRIQESLAARRLFLDQEEVELVVSLGLCCMNGAMQQIQAEELVAQARQDQRLARSRGSEPVEPSADHS